VGKAALSGNVANNQEAKSAMQFVRPGMCRVVSGDAWQASICSARIQRRDAALVAFAARNLVAHAIVSVLSHQHTTWAWVR